MSLFVTVLDFVLVDLGNLQMDFDWKVPVG